MKKILDKYVYFLIIILLIKKNINMLKKLKIESLKILRIRQQYKELKNFNFFNKYRKLWRSTKVAATKTGYRKIYSGFTRLKYESYFQHLNIKNIAFFTTISFKLLKHIKFWRMVSKNNIKNLIWKKKRKKNKVKFLKYSKKKKFNFLKNFFKTNIYKNYYTNYVVLYFKLGYERNLYLNISKFTGEVLKKYSGGMFYKGKLKFSKYALEELFFKSTLVSSLHEIVNKKNKLIIRLASKKKNKKIKFHIRKILRENYNIRRYIFILQMRALRAHNGVRKKKLPRK